MTDIDFPSQRPETRQHMEFEISKLSKMLHALADRITELEQRASEAAQKAGMGDGARDLPRFVRDVTEHLARANAEWAEVSHRVKLWRL